MIQYIIQREDSLHFIALKFKASVMDIMKANNISDPNNVYPGQMIMIPNMRSSFPSYDVFPSLHRKDQGPFVQLLQNKLQHAGFYNGALNGIFDEETEKAVNQFAKFHNINHYGTVSQEMWRVLNSSNNIINTDIPCACSVENSGILLSLSLQHRNYYPGQTLDMQLILLNISTHSIALNYTTSQRYDFMLQDSAGKTIWQWSLDRAFAQTLSIDHLSPIQAETYKENFEIPSYFSEGIYYLLAWNTSKQLEKKKIYLPFGIYKV